MRTNSASAQTVALTCHPEARSDAVRRIEARIRKTSDALLALTFCLQGDLVRLRIPPPRPPRRADRLWEHTCFEVFVAVSGRPEYHELNFAPSGEWASFAFRRYRDGGAPTNEELAPGILLRRGRDRLELDAVIHLDRLPPADPHAPLRLALCAVVEEQGGALAYWALRHPPGKPDFHHPEGFALQLEPAPKVALGA